jgi:UPF0716 protein FxsA
MIWKILTVFVMVPTIELIVLLFVGAQIGPLPTTLLIIITAMTGGWLAKREGLGVLKKLRTDLKNGLPPAGLLTEGALVLAGALLLISPGLFTDITGFSLMIPWSRRKIAPILLAWVTAKFMPQGTKPDGWKVDFTAKASTEPVEPGTPPDNHFNHPVA